MLDLLLFWPKQSASHALVAIAAALLVVLVVYFLHDAFKGSASDPSLPMLLVYWSGTSVLWTLRATASLFGRSWVLGAIADVVAVGATAAPVAYFLRDWLSEQADKFQKSLIAADNLGTAQSAIVELSTVKPQLSTEDAVLVFVSGVVGIFVFRGLAFKMKRKEDLAIGIGRPL